MLECRSLGTSGLQAYVVRFGCNNVGGQNTLEQAKTILKRRSISVAACFVPPIFTSLIPAKGFPVNQSSFWRV